MKTLLLLATIIAMNCGPAVFRAKCQATNTVKAADDDLPPEVLMDQYLQEAQTAYKAEKWKEAVEQYAKVMALKTEPPVEAHYEYAVCLNKQLCDPNPSLVETKKYLKAAGRDGKNYQEALALLTSAQASARIWNKEQKYQAINETFVANAFSGFSAWDGTIYKGYSEPGFTSYAINIYRFGTEHNCGKISLEIFDYDGVSDESRKRQEITLFPSQIADIRIGSPVEHKRQFGATYETREVTLLFKEPLQKIYSINDVFQSSEFVPLIALHLSSYKSWDGNSNVIPSSRAYNQMINSLQEVIAQVKSIDEKEAAKAGTENK